MMNDVAQRYCEMYGSAREAIPFFAANLMAGDPGTFKNGYSRENAIIATAEAFDISRDAVEELVP